ncbi:MAG: biopolymer transporter ExbD [Phycisphaerales bacterium]|nr:biopolymer transporter ExbD [Phycisphaerales bacterium]
MRPHLRMRRRLGSGGLTLHMAPMIDIVFLLLIYFMVATDFSPAEEIFRLDLPEQQAASSDPLALIDEPLLIRLESMGYGGGIEVVGPWTVSPTPEGLRRFLAESVQPRGQLFLSDHPIIIEPASDVSWERVIDTFNAVVAAGCTNVTLETPS